MNDRAEGVKAGMDLEMPGSKGCGLNGDTVYKALEAGTLTEEDIDKDVLRLIRFAYENTVREVEGVTFDVEKHNDIARRAAEGGAVLLKNDGILPLNKNKVSPSSADSQNKSAIKAVVRATFFPQNLRPSPTRSTKSDKNIPTPTATFSKAKATKELDQKAVKAAKGKDVVLLFVGLTDAFESEGYDRHHIKMPSSHVTLINEILKVNKTSSWCFLAALPSKSASGTRT